MPSGGMSAIVSIRVADRSIIRASSARSAFGTPASSLITSAGTRAA